MNEQLEFTIQSLLSERKGIVHGPMSPLLFAKEMGKPQALSTTASQGFGSGTNLLISTGKMGD